MLSLHSPLLLLTLIWSLWGFPLGAWEALMFLLHFILHPKTVQVNHSVCLRSEARYREVYAWLLLLCSLNSCSCGHGGFPMEQCLHSPQWCVVLIRQQPSSSVFHSGFPVLHPPSMPHEQWNGSRLVLFTKVAQLNSAEALSCHFKWRSLVSCRPWPISLCICCVLCLHLLSIGPVSQPLTWPGSRRHRLLIFSSWIENPASY